MSHPDRDPVVSVIVPVRNRGKALRTLLTALDCQSLPRAMFEVVISDDGSDDGSTTGVATMDGHIRVLHNVRKNPYAARNSAVRAARGQYIAGCDSDCVPEPEWLVCGLAALETADVVGGMIRFLLPRRRTIWTLMDIDTFIDQESVVASGGVLGGNMFFDRDVFARVGGFDETLANGGDQEFAHRCTANGASLSFAPEAVVWHPSRDSRRLFLRKCWDVNLRYGMREARQGRRPYATRLRWWVPIIPTVRSRRRLGRTLRLDRRRLGNSRVKPTLREDVLGLLIVYALMPLLTGVAQTVGWLAGRKCHAQLLADVAGMSAMSPPSEQGSDAASVTCNGI